MCVCMYEQTSYMVYVYVCMSRQAMWYMCVCMYVQTSYVVYVCIHICEDKLCVCMHVCADKLYESNFYVSLHFFHKYFGV